MPATKKKRTPNKNLKKPTRRFGKLSIATAVVAIVAVAFVLTGVREVLPSATVTQRFPGDPNPLVSGKAFFGSSGEHIAEHEAATGKSVGLYRKFYQWGQASAAASAISSNYSANRLMWVSFKTPKWADVGSGMYDTTLDGILRTIDGAGHPVWVTFWHEPENDEGASNAGTAADWLNMQKRVRARMTVVGTKNIAFAPIYQSSKIVSMGATHNNWYAAGVWDFLGFDIYKQDATKSILDTNWTTTINWITSKGQPYAIGEWGVRVTAPPSQITDFWNWPFTNKKDMVGMAYFDSDANSVGSWILSGGNNTTWNTILKSDARVMRVQDLGSSVPVDNGSGGGGSGGGSGGGTTTPSSDKTAPVVGITSPKKNAVVAGKLTITATATDDKTVTAVTLRVDDKYLETDKTSPYSFGLDTAKYSDGSHTIVIRAFDAAGNMGEASATVAVSNAVTSGGSSGGTPITVVTTEEVTTPSTPVPVSGTVVVQPSETGSTVSVAVDGKPVNGTAVDTTALTNGTHTLTITENGQKKKVYIEVKNPWQKAFVNEVKANPVAYSVSGGVLLAALAAVWAFRSTMYAQFLRFKDRNLVTFGTNNQLASKPRKK